MKKTHLLLCGILACAGTLSAQVPRKISVLDLEKKGLSTATADWEFLSRSLGQQVEIGLDRTGKVLIIRKYLWKEVYGSDASVTSPAEASAFAAKAGVDGVIFGRIEYGKKSASVSLKAFDAAKGKIAVEQTFSLPYTEGIFSTAETPLEKFVASVTQAFPALSERESAAVSKKVKVVYQDISRPVHQIRFSASPALGMSKWRIPQDNASGTQASNEIEGGGFMPGVRFSAGYQFRVLDLEAGAVAFFNPGNNSSHIFPFARIGAWLFKDMIRISVRPSWSMDRTPGSSASVFYLGFGFDLKPSDDFLFGMTLGPILSSDIAIRDWSAPGMSKGRMENNSANLFLIHFELRVWKSLFANLSMTGFSCRKTWRSTIDDSEQEYEMRTDQLDLALVWKTGWGTR